MIFTFPRAFLPLTYQLNGPLLKKFILKVNGKFIMKANGKFSIQEAISCLVFRLLKLNVNYQILKNPQD